MEREAPGDEPRIEISEDAPYDPSQGDPAGAAAAEDDENLADTAPDLPGEEFEPTDPER
jgi:hypothetical protein